MTKLFIHASDVGLGHRRRCEALASYWPDDVVWDGPSEPGVFVIDDYENLEYSARNLESLGCLVVVITDLADIDYGTVVINTNIGANQWYDRYDVPYKLLGPRYFLLPPVFLRLPKHACRGTFDAAEANREWSQDEFAHRLARAEYVVCGSGQTAYQSIFLGKATFLRFNGPHEKRAYDQLIDGGWAYPATDENLEKLARGFHFFPRFHPTPLIDGVGTQRVVRTLEKIYDAQIAKLHES